MTQKKFDELVSKTEAHMKEVWADNEQHALNEQAVPSYLSPYPIVKKIFWKRVKIIIDALEQSPNSTVLDFGCGVGTLFLFLAEIGVKKVYAIDNDTNAVAGAQRMIEKYSLQNVELLTNPDALQTISNQSLNAVLALDVLEHVDDLSGTVQQFHAKLINNGKLFVSGPSENWLYRLSRKFGGAHYKHHFHVRNIYDIRNEIDKTLTVHPLATIWPAIPFFIIFTGSKNSTN